MLSKLDFELFPVDCLVYYNGQSAVYPIFKNGSSSLEKESKVHQWKKLSKNKISELYSIDVYLRDPDIRLNSGISTYIDNLMKENIALNREIIIFFIEKYGFLNRHYMPQFHWILHLARFISKNTIINLLPIEKMSKWTLLQSNKSSEYNDYQILNDDVFHLIDKILVDNLINTNITFNEIMQYFQNNCKEEYDEILKIQDRINPMYAL